MAQLYFWLELGELSQLGSAQLAILRSVSEYLVKSSGKTSEFVKSIVIK